LDVVRYALIDMYIYKIRIHHKTLALDYMASASSLKEVELLTTFRNTNHALNGNNKPVSASFVLKIIIMRDALPLIRNRDKLSSWH
jgi:hypothetical protein